MATKDLGPVSAYALAVSKGYAGTEEEFATLMANYGTVAQRAETAAQTAVTAEAGAVAALQRSGLVEFRIDANDHLIYTKTEVVAVGFDINDSGHLIVQEAS